MHWENAKGVRTPPKINSQENKDYYGPLLSDECNTDIKKRIARRLKVFSVKSEADLSNLVIEGAVTGERMLDSDRKFLEKFTGLEVLAINESGLKLIDNLPDLPSLMQLELCYNEIERGLEHLHGKFPLLRILKLRSNQIGELDEVRHLKQCSLLHYLDLYMCPVTEVPKYRRTVFEMLEQITTLDYRDRGDLD